MTVFTCSTSPRESTLEKLLLTLAFQGFITMGHFLLLLCYGHFAPCDSGDRLALSRANLGACFCHMVILPHQLILFPSSSDH